MPFLKMCEGNVEANHQNGDDINAIITIPTEDVNLNAYQLGKVFFESPPEYNLEVKDLSEEGFASICYSLIIFISILMVILSFLSKFYMVKILIILNIFLLSISTVLLIKSGFIKEYTDVKYGFYIFLIYSILSLRIARKEILDQKKL